MDGNHLSNWVASTIHQLLPLAPHLPACLFVYLTPAQLWLRGFMGLSLCSSVNIVPPPACGWPQAGGNSQSCAPTCRASPICVTVTPGGLTPQVGTRHARKLLVGSLYLYLSNCE